MQVKPEPHTDSPPALLTTKAGKVILGYTYEIWKEREESRVREREEREVGHVCCGTKTLHIFRSEQENVSGDIVTEH